MIMILKVILGREPRMEMANEGSPEKNGCYKVHGASILELLGQNQVFSMPSFGRYAYTFHAAFESVAVCNECTFSFL